LLLETTLTLESTFPHRARTLSGAPSQFSARHWDTASLTDNRAWHNDAYWINERAKQQRYSFRMLRYWYMAELLLAERKRLGRPLAVLEVGVDRGQMKAFIDGIPSQDPGTPLYASWNAADVKPQQEALIAAGYAGCSTLNLDDASSLAKFSAAHTKKYDVVILLHVLEHLHHPERAVTFISATLQDGGIALGGFPVLPSGLASIRERQLKRTAQPFGHVSAFSPQRVRNMAQGAGMACEYAAGAFAVRASGSFLENHAWWLRLNVTFGALMPSWPGEIYWQLRKPIPRNQTGQAIRLKPVVASSSATVAGGDPPVSTPGRFARPSRAHS
jgi:SAM-dependent methyltransferase